MSAESEKNPTQGFFTVFLSKLREQSFTIILMVGLLYFQYTMRNQDHLEMERQNQQLENRLREVLDRERSVLLEREKHLVEQRDSFIVYLREQISACKSLPKEDQP